MGLREKADFSLQAVTLFVALLTALFLCAARHYTSDWRDRRVFRKHLARTQNRLKPGETKETSTSNSETDGTLRSSRRQWKRFVAALPFMPLATAYVAVRIAWDLFELLVFCAIDGARDAATNAVRVVRMLGVFAYSQSVRLLAEFDVRRRAQDMLIAVVENTVVWLFQTAFPALAALGDRCAQQLRLFAGWWARRGGPWLTDAIERLVVGAVVPSFLWASSALQVLCARALWLGTRVVQAATILANDLSRDIAIAYTWITHAVSWLTSHQRWWFNSDWIRLISLHLVPSAERLREIYRILKDAILPRCALLLCRAYTDAVVPLGRQLFRYADHVLQIAVGAGIRIYKGLIVAKPALLEILELLSRVDFYAPAVSTFIWVSENVAPAIVRGPRHAWRAFYAWIKQSAWIVGVLWDAYARLRDYLLVPFTHALFRGCTALWQSIVRSSISIAAWRWLATVAWPLVSQALAHCLRESDRLFAALSARLWELLCTQGVLFSRWYAHCTLLLGDTAGWMYDVLCAASLWLQANGSVVVAAVWPLVCRGFDDGVDAMRDVYRRLLVAMDNAVAAVGDKVVELARKGAVHDETHAHGHNSSTKPGATHDVKSE
ncbi:hypothetical protein GGI11_002352 [Coemansia sp. RSA 2049]|nr:hypothetical protein H4217_006150 [Coemansia sp. RSA 1939]KAJ2520204.1 hypothetical protein GGI11_002352 [Coemansia sp. RSA 2049]KAJ2606229.1 hypothetical protein EV177_005972 [Coemansia sp. RSA 1804]